MRRTWETGPNEVYVNEGFRKGWELWVFGSLT